LNANCSLEVSFSYEGKSLVTQITKAIVKTPAIKKTSPTEKLMSFSIMAFVLSLYRYISYLILWDL